MRAVSNLMRDYFSDAGHARILAEGLPKDVPIKAKKVEWKLTQDGTALLRTYEFKNLDNLRRFVDQLLGMQARIDHHAQLLIEKKTVKIRVGTPTLNRVTELDTEYATEADHIFDESGGSGE